VEEDKKHRGGLAGVLFTVFSTGLAGTLRVVTGTFLSKEGDVKKAIYHLQHVNSYHKRLKDWMQRFQGVATKYLG
jgi:hypothetical protein